MEQTNNLAIALVAGEPYSELPEDLYIPPDALQVFLSAFEGPLDLLLYLIKKQNLDITNIPVFQITKQYVAYLEMMGELQLELAADYLLMGAVLAEIKSRLLLPRQTESEDDEADPRAELMRRLLEYEAIKKVSIEIDALPRDERDTFRIYSDVSAMSVERQLADVTLQEMVTAFEAVLKRVEQLAHHQIIKEPLSVRERMASILEKLAPSTMNFVDVLIKSEGKQGVIVSFLAILELSKEGLVEIIQETVVEQLQLRLVGV